MRENTVVNKPVGIWIRVSTEDQAKGESPKHHKDRAESYAKSRGWQVKEIYDLAGQSGKAVKEHPEAKRMAVHAAGRQAEDRRSTHRKDRHRRRCD